MSAGPPAGPARGDSLWWLACGAVIVLACGALLAVLVALSGHSVVRDPAPGVPTPVAVPAAPSTAAVTPAPPASPKAGGGYVPLYAIAARTFGVNWLLIASVHRQETAFSTEPGTYAGLNFAGCCAGPMQFNVTNGSVTTWSLYRSAFRYAARPAVYPHPTATHPSVYDDFDSIMAAAWLLRSAGAGPVLDASAWRAAYAYYGHDAFGTQYADQVVARAASWSLHGFSPSAEPGADLVARYDAAYGAPARAQLGAKA